MVEYTFINLNDIKSTEFKDHFDDYKLERIPERGEILTLGSTRYRVLEVESFLLTNQVNIYLKPIPEIEIRKMGIPY